MELKSKRKSAGERKEVERKFCYLLRKQGINFATGVPCGVQKYIIEKLSTDSKITHLVATKESEAIGVAAGAYLAGKSPVIYMQNSGLLNSINDITSLLIAYRIPILFSVTWRGAPGEDAPQHFINGQSTMKILEAIGIPYQVLTKENMEKVVESSFEEMKERQIPAVMLIARGTLG